MDNSDRFTDHFQFVYCDNCCWKETVSQNTHLVNLVWSNNSGSFTIRASQPTSPLNLFFPKEVELLLGFHHRQGIRRPGKVYRMLWTRFAQPLIHRERYVCGVQWENKTLKNWGFYLFLYLKKYNYHLRNYFSFSGYLC